MYIVAKIIYIFLEKLLNALSRIELRHQNCLKVFRVIIIYCYYCISTYSKSYYRCGYLRSLKL